MIWEKLTLSGHPNMSDPRVYVLVYFSSSSSYGFIALRDSRINATNGIEYIPLETWNDKYVIYRVAYTREKGAEKISSDGMMDGPDLYTVFDKANETSIITIWKPRNTRGIEFVFGSETEIKDAMSFDDIRQNCVSMSHIQITKCDVVHEHDVFREFIL